MTRMNKLLLLLSVTVCLTTCKDPWDEHARLRDGVATKCLSELISERQDLSQFWNHLVSAGFDKELATASIYTVWVPDNEAMAGLDEAILNNADRLKSFVANHITYGLYPYHSGLPLQQVKTFSGKNLLIDNVQGKIEESFLLEPHDIMALNGILHIIDKPMVPKMNIWEFIENTEFAANLTGFLNSLSGMVFNSSIATQIGIDPYSGLPVYDTLSGLEWSNYFVNYVRDLTNEDSISTMVLITDDVFDQQFAAYRPYYLKATPEASDSLTRWQIARDLVFPGIYDPAGMPDTLVSSYGVKVPFNTGAVVHEFDASNGMVYVINACDIPVGEKILPVIIEGEAIEKYVTTSLVGQQGYTREKPLASGGYDFILDNHGANPGAIQYHAGPVYATTYLFYWKAVDDFNYSYRYPDPGRVIVQRLDRVNIIGMEDDRPFFGPPIPISADSILVIDFTYFTATERYLGQVKFLETRDLWLQVRGSGNNTTLVVDYLKMVPVFE